MRRCANCAELTPQDSPVCCNCLYTDLGWAQHIERLLRQGKGRALRRSKSDIQLTFLEQFTADEPLRYTVRLSAFSDSGELGFHLQRITELVQANPHRPIEVICNGASWGYEWDYASDFDPERDQYLPPSLPIPSLVEVSRFIHTVLSRNDDLITIKMVLPPETHASTKFVKKTGLFSALPPQMISYADHALDQTFLPGSDDIFIPLCPVGPDTGGQLSSQFHQGFNRLADAGYFKHEHRSSLRRMIMEAAENADVWGGGGWIACFLRQEKRGAGRFGHQNSTFSPARETHLFLHVFSIGATLAETTHKRSEWEAAMAVADGYSGRLTGGGKGMPYILKTITESAVGTAYICSGNYTCIITPDGLVREYLSAGSEYLPGVHLCAVIPLAIIAELQPTPATKAIGAVQ
jgi:hypothetical protein